MAETTGSVVPDSSSSSHDTGGKHTGLLIGIIAGIVLGILVGGFLPSVAVYFSILGDIFLNALMMLVVPLVILSMIVGITGLGDIRNLGSIGRRTILYYLLTTGIAVVIGIIMVNIIQPGVGISPGEKHPDVSYTVADKRTVVLQAGTWVQQGYNEKYEVILTDQGVKGEISEITENTVTVKHWESTDPGEQFYVTAEDGSRLPVRRVEGRIVSAVPDVAPSGTGVEIALSLSENLRGKEKRGVGQALEEVLIGNKESGKQGLIPRNIFDAMVHLELLPLIFFSLLLGAALSVLGERVKPTVAVIATLNDAVMRLVHWIMIIAPVGIFGLIAARIGEKGGFVGALPELVALGKYALTVLIGLGIHGFVILPLILKFLGRRNPVTYARGVAPALLNAFSTASSSATLPLTIQGVEEENGISNRTASFVLPLGATINMDGTALYEAVAAMFIAQVYVVPMDLMMQAVVVLTATLAAIGAAGIPEAGLVTMVIVLKAVGLPVEGIGLILAIDFFLDRFRTTVNVWGDSIGAGVIETLETKDVKP